MDVSSIAATATAMSSAQNSRDASVAVARKSLSHMESQGQAVIKLISGAAIQPASASNSSVHVVA